MLTLHNVTQTLTSWSGETPEGQRIDIHYLQSERDKLTIRRDGESPQLIYLADEYAGVFCTADLRAIGYAVQSWKEPA